ncbi:MAG TPA: protein phosphatase 2C domain-containing protein [Gemmataceae bacterium]|nr:protein phosphatase 2C domain-containing protein [Gemmataceae bacterium]
MPFFKEIDHFGATDVGVKRTHNQDAFTVQKAPDRAHWDAVGHLFIVADGMGGHAVGEKASAKAVQEIPLTYVKHVGDGPAGALRRAFQEANAGINAIGTSNPEFRGLGTTATAVVLRDEGAWIAHVGDSRAYRVRGGQIQQLSYDHSYAWEMARRLGIPPEELGDVKRNVIVRSLGPDPLVQVDVEGPYPLEDGDTFVLCSDGLSNLVPPDEIGAVLAVLPIAEAGKLLIELANLRGGPDNITVLIVRVGSTKDSVAAPAVGKSAKVSRKVSDAWKAWNQRVAWPISILLVGFALAVLFVIFVINNWALSSLLLVAAILAIGIGVAGLFVHARQEREAPEVLTNAPTRASVYRQYPVRIDAGLVDRWVKATLQLKEQLEAREWPVDWAGSRAAADQAQKALKDGDVLFAFQCQARALAKLAAPYNKHRPKEEGFKPKWDSAV